MTDVRLQGGMTLLEFLDLHFVGLWSLVAFVTVVFAVLRVALTLITADAMGRMR